MATVNKVFIIGYLGGDPEERQTANGSTVVNMSIATTEKWSDGEHTDWHKIVVWGKQGESCARHLSKGSLCCVEGRVQYREWEDRDGNKRWWTEIVAQRVTFLGGRKDGGGRRNGPPPQEPPRGGGQNNGGDDDIPW